MSTKNTIVFIFMVLFLGSTLYTLGAWFHYSLELDIQEKALLSIEERQKDLNAIGLKLDKIRANPEYGLEARLEQWTQKADRIEALVHTDPAARKKLYEEKAPLIGEAWQAGKKKWDAVYADWKTRNEKLRTAAKSLKDLQKESTSQVEQEQAELLKVLKKEEVDRVEYLAKRKKLEETAEKVRFETEELRERINKVSRDLEKTPEEEADGVVIFSAPDLSKVTVNIGYHHGARRGMKFKIFSGRHNVPIRKGELVLTDVRALTSDGITRAQTTRPLWDKVTGWEAENPKMRYSKYHAEEGTEAVRLEKRKTKRDIVEDLRIERIRQEQGADAAELARSSADSPNEPPIQAELGDGSIEPGDWISNTEFVRIVTEREFQRQVNDELLGMKDVNVGVLTFYIANSIRAYRQEFLKRLCARNRCRVTDFMTSDVDFVVTTRVTARIDLLEKSLERFKDQEDVPAAIAHKRETLAALKEAVKFGSQVIVEDELETFFIKRKRKSELTKGKAIQPGQHVFYVVGETRRRSIRETKLFIQELGGKISLKLDEEVDYVVVGAGLHNATLDIKSGRVYPKDQMPPDQVRVFEFYDAVKKMGWKVLREDALEQFFGRK